MSSTRTHPRRRGQNTTVLDTSCAAPLPSVNPKYSSEAAQTMCLQKGATFHASKGPSATNDPVINVRGLPARSPTSPESLEALVEATKEKLAGFSFLGPASPGDKAQAESLPVPEFIIARASLPDIPKKSSKYDHSLIPSSETFQNTHSHDSDSGLGSSVGSLNSHDSRSTADRLRLSEDPHESREHTLCANFLECKAAHGRSSVYQSSKPAAEPPISSSTEVDSGRALSDNAAKQIQERIIKPLLADEKLKGYHKLIGSLPDAIADKKVVCLRDLEKRLVFLAPVSEPMLLGDSLYVAKPLLNAMQSCSKTAASYYNFCLSSIDLIVRTVGHLNDHDLRQPSDRPYTNNYFVDLIEQVRQYAGIMAASRKKQAEGKPLNKDDYTSWVPLSEFPSLKTLTWPSNERLELSGGMSVNGQPAQLVREKDGKTIPIDTEQMELGDESDDDPERSMARKRKCDIGKEVWHACRECGKQFKRPCDLTKHEKTHSRPWKCMEPNCKYHMLGWPTEKERDRHFNDKHTSTPSLYQCRYEGCTYTSKRESNCKQHMEKTHGYEYVRSKSKKAERLVPMAAGQTPEQTALLTPSSAFQSIPTPVSDFTSPQMAMMGNELSPPATDEGASPYNGNANNMSLFENNTAMMGGNFDANLNFGELQPGSHEMTPNGSTNLGTPGSLEMFAEGEPLMPDDWNMRFDFGELAMEQGIPSPEEFFGTSTFAQGAQQPTPAMSDFDLSKDMMAENQKMTATAEQQNLMFNQQPDSLPSSAFNVNAGDFSLFGEQGESSNMASMFAEMNGNGQFNQNNANTNFDFNNLENFGANM